MEENIEKADQNQREEQNEEIEGLKVNEKDEKKEGNEKVDQKEGDEKVDQKEGDEKDEQRDKTQKEKEKKQKKESKELSLYFIETFSNDSSLKMELVESKNAKNLEIVKNGNLEDKEEVNYIIYRVKIITNSPKDIIKIKLISKENKKFKAEIKLSENNHDIFYYDFNQFNEKISKKDKSYGFNVSHLHQFKIYLNYIEESIAEEQRDSEIDSLVLSTSKYFIIKEKKDKKEDKKEDIKDKEKEKEKEGKKENKEEDARGKEREKIKEKEFYDYSLFLYAFKVCYKRQIIIKLLSEFQLDKVDMNKISSNLSPIEKNNIKLILDKLENDPEAALKFIEEKNEKMKNKIHLYYIIICFRLIFERETLLNSLNNILKNKDIQNRIYKAIVKNNELFEGTKFSKEQISKMVDVSDTFKRIKRALKYLLYTSDLLEIISGNLDHIIDVRNEELKEKGKKSEDFTFKIDIEILKETDDISKIYKYYKNILDKQKEKDIDNFIVFGPKLFDKYISYFKNNNFEYLVLLRNLINQIYTINNAKVQKNKKQKKNKEDDDILKKYKDLKVKLKQIIHETGICLSTEKKLSNIQILNFIKEDSEYIKEIKNEDEIEKTLELFEGIDMSSINDEFLAKWKNINWQDIFADKSENIYNKIRENVNNFKEFDILMKILNINQNDSEMKFSQESIKMMREKFVDIFIEQNNKEEKEFENSLIELIYQSDLERSNEIIEFLKYFEDKMNFNSMKNIYHKLCVMHEEKLSEETKNEIILYFLENSEDENHKVLIEFAKNFKFLRINIFKNLVDKELKKEDLLNTEENEKIILFKALLEVADIKDEKYQDIEYVSNSMNVLKESRKNFDNNEVLYNEINIIFQNNKEDEFKKRLFLIYFDDNDKVEFRMNDIKQKINIINSTLKTLNLINNDLNEFLSKSEEKNIEKIKSLISGLLTKELNYYDNKSGEISFFIAEYGKNAEKRNKKKKSLFFQSIYNENGLDKNLKEEDRVKKTEEEFDKLSEIFISGLEKIPKDIMAICLNTIKNMNDEEVDKEIEELIKIFDKKIDYKLFDKKKMILKMKMLSKRDDIIDTANSIKTFIEKIGVKKGNFYDLINDNMEILKNSYNEIDIIGAKNLLLDAGINIDILYDKEYQETDKTNYINILKMLTENSNSISFLIDIKLDQCQTLKEFIGEDESGSLNINDIIDLEKCVKFMISLKSEQNFSEMEDTKLIKLFVDNIEKSKESLEAMFKTYTSNFSQIRTLFDSKLEISEASNQKIKYICQKSYFILKSTKDNCFKCTYLKEMNIKEVKETDILIHSKNINKIGLFEECSKLENNPNKENSILKGIEKKKISLIFNSTDQKIKNYNVSCFNTDIFEKLIKDKIYYKYPEFERKANYFLAKGKLINEKFSLAENQIEDGAVILVHAESIIQLDSLLELRDRAQLTKKISGDFKEEITKETKIKFIRIISEINKIISKLKKIRLRGYPKIIEIQINLGIDFQRENLEKVYSEKEKIEKGIIENEKIEKKEKEEKLKKLKEEIKQKLEKEKLEFLEYLRNCKPKYYYRESEKSEKKEKEINDILGELDNIYISLRDIQIKAYKNNEKPYTRFIYGRQFNLIRSLNKEKINPFLMYFTRNLKTEEIENFKFDNDNDIESIINDCHRYLSEVLKKNNLNLESIYSTSIINREFEYKGLYLYLTNSELLERDLFLIYKYMTNHFPISQNILLCTKETSSEELTAFLYRAILCDFNVCYILGGIEYLEDEKKSEILKILSDLFVGRQEKIKSCLIILYTTKNSDIYKNLSTLKYRKDLNISLRDYSQKKLNIKESKVELIVSDESGVGKSHKIKLDIDTKKKKYIYFPFGGVINREDIIKRLKILKLSEQRNTAIHLDLYDTDQTELMTEFLFSILITKIYGHDEDLFYFPKEIEIKIEIPNGFVDLISKFPILSLFEKTTLLLRELPDLTVSNELNSNIQIVANYLKMYKDNEIDNFDLYFEGTTPANFKFYKNKKNAEILSQNECQSLIFEEIKKEIPKPNYYQIKSFIDVLATQFKTFNRNYNISVNTLNNFGIHESIRSFIIENYIKLTKHFTKGAYSELIQTQQETRQIINSNQYNPEDDISQGIEKLSKIKPNLISFNKFNYSLIFIHEGEGEGFSIISNLPGKNNYKENSDYKGLYKLRNFQAIIGKNREKVDIPNYKNYSQNDFLVELKEILGLKNPSTIEEKNNRKIPRSKDICESNEQIKNKNEEIRGVGNETDEIIFQSEDLLNELTELKRRIDENQIINEEEIITIFGKIDKEDEKVKQINEKIRKINDGREENEKFFEYEEYELLSLEEIVGKYVFTADNFVKMILILLRIRAGIPVIMMGETGCGKTSLISMLSKLLNNGSDKNMKVLNIHAGISDNDIINFIEKEILNEAELIDKKNRDEELERVRRGQIYIPKKIWVFLDEINTCKSMGLISELMCKHSYQGKTLSSNVVFIAACNPYRYGIKISVGLSVDKACKEQKKLNEREKKKIKRNANTDLVYTVNPLPHSLLNYVFDFGNLEPNDEIKYIESIVEKSIKKKAINLNKEQINNIHKFATRLISKAQNFIRDNYGIASVSLREIRRFNIFYEFFYNLFQNKKSEMDDFYNKCDSLTLHKYSIIMGIFICYYLRIIENNIREKFNQIMTKEMRELDFMDHTFLEIPRREEEYVIKNIELDKGIAPNRALLDNIFSLFVAINNKIPIFIVGKPGCSKSLSVQLIIRAMENKKTDKPLFQNLPKILVNSYQGSMASTSKGVEKVFNNAKNIYDKLDEKNKKDYISMIFFDEMGLAEHSPNNPLKVIHAELDVALEEGKNNLAFVGISNWTLDASKMNRGMHLSIPEPNENDIKNVAFTIGKSYDKNLANQYKVYFENLGLAYYKYKIKYLKIIFNKEIKEDFHGNRDFYHLIKYCARNLVDELKKKENEFMIKDIEKIKKKIAFLGFERNFGGLKFNESTSIKIIKLIYSGVKSDN